jgi:prepilin-type N-terminal cleavage/methylation domain-containing protein
MTCITKLTRPRKSRRGVTLVEIMIAIGLLAIALAGVAAAIAHGQWAEQSNRELANARDVVMRTIDDIRSRPVNQSLATYLTANASSPVTDLPNGTRTITFSPAAPWPADTSDPYLVEVHVRVDWTGARGASRFENYTMLTR